MLCLISEIGEGGAFARHGAGSVPAAYDQGSAAPGVPGRDDPVFREQEHRAGTFYRPEHILDALHEALALDYQKRNELGRVDFSATELAQRQIHIQEMLRDLLLIVDFRHGDDGESSEVGVHQEGLCVGVADDTYARASLEFGEFLFEFRSEVVAFKAVDTSEEAGLRVVGGHSCPAGAEVRVIIDPIEEIICARSLS